MTLDIQLEVDKKVNTKKVYNLIEKIRNLANNENVGFSVKMKKTVRKSQLEKIEDIVCEEMSEYLKEPISIPDLYKNTRKPSSSMPRQVMSAFLMSSMKPDMIAKKYGLAQRSTIIYSENKVKMLASVDGNYKRVIQAIERRANIQIL